MTLTHQPAVVASRRSKKSHRVDFLLPLVPGILFSRYQSHSHIRNHTDHHHSSAPPNQKSRPIDFLSTHCTFLPFRSSSSSPSYPLLYFTSSFHRHPRPACDYQSSGLTSLSLTISPVYLTPPCPLLLHYLFHITHGGSLGPSQS